MIFVTISLIVGQKTRLVDIGDYLTSGRVSIINPLIYSFHNCFKRSTDHTWREGNEMERCRLTLFCLLGMSFYRSMFSSLSTCSISQYYHFQDVRAIKKQDNVNPTRIMGV